MKGTLKTDFSGEKGDEIEWWYEGENNPSVICVCESVTVSLIIVDH